MAFDQRIYDTLTRTEKQLYVRFDGAMELNTEQLAEFMGYSSKQTVHTNLCTGEFPIPTYKRGRHRMASLRHVALYQESIEQDAVCTMVKTHKMIDKGRGQHLEAVYAER